MAHLPSEKWSKARKRGVSDADDLVRDKRKLDPCSLSDGALRLSRVDDISNADEWRNRSFAGPDDAELESVGHKRSLGLGGRRSLHFGGDFEGRTRARTATRIAAEPAQMYFEKAYTKLKSVSGMQAASVHSVACCPGADRWKPADFWASTGEVCAAKDYYRTVASPQPSVDLFVSHVWRTPEDWTADRYAEVKVRVARRVLRRIAADEGRGYVRGWHDIDNWIDKASSPQNGEEVKELAKYGFFFVEYLAITDGLLLLLVPDYPKRLWCLYELSIKIALSDPGKVHVGMVEFIREGIPFDKYLDSIRDISVAAAQCWVQADREMLADKIDQFYTSTEDFERFSKFSLLALVAMNIASTKYSVRPRESLAKLCSLSEELQFHELAEAIKMAPDPRTGMFIQMVLPLCALLSTLYVFFVAIDDYALRRATMPITALAVVLLSFVFAGYNFEKARARRWFKSHILPLLNVERKVALRPGATAHVRRELQHAKHRVGVVTYERRLQWARAVAHFLRRLTGAVTLVGWAAYSVGSALDGRFLICRLCRAGCEVQQLQCGEKCPEDIHFSSAMESLEEGGVLLLTGALAMGVWLTFTGIDEHATRWWARRGLPAVRGRDGEEEGCLAVPPGERWPPCLAAFGLVLACLLYGRGVWRTVLQRIVQSAPQSVSSCINAPDFSMLATALSLVALFFLVELLATQAASRLRPTPSLTGRSPSGLPLVDA